MEEKEREWTKKDYNDIPVHYCRHCLSLRIVDAGGFDYCDDCGSTDIHTDHIDVWEKIYELRNFQKFLYRKNKPGKYFNK